MGASLSTGGEPAEEEGVTVVSTGTPRAPQTQADEDLLHRLAALKHSLPLIPESISEPGSLWSRSLQRLPPTSSSSKHLDGDLLKHMGVDYQRYTQQHASKVARRQEGLNAAIPRLEQQAVQLQQQLAGEAKGAAAAAANFGAAEGVRQELEALAARLGRLQQSLGEVERLVQQRVAGGGT